MPTGNDVAEVAADVAAEDARWRQWKLKGRNDDARFRRRLKTVVGTVTAVLAVAGTLWFAYAFATPLN